MDCPLLPVGVILEQDADVKIKASAKAAKMYFFSIRVMKLRFTSKGNRCLEKLLFINDTKEPARNIRYLFSPVKPFFVKDVSSAGKY
jgi:hypothetical protein